MKTILKLKIKPIQLYLRLIFYPIKQLAGLFIIIKSRDSLTRFRGLFLVQLDSSDFATPAGTGSFFKIKSILCQIFDFLGLGASSFRSEQISAQRATGAHSTPLPGLIFVIVFISHTAEILLSHQK
jgi:hypothetical protein